MPTKRGKIKKGKGLGKKPKESNKETTNKEMSSAADDELDPKIQSSVSVSPQVPLNKDTDNPASCSDTMVPTRSKSYSTLHTDMKDKETESVTPNIKTDTTSTDVIPEQAEADKKHGEKSGGNSRNLKQMLLSPKSDSSSSKTKRKNKTKSSKGNKKEEKSKQPIISDFFVARRSQRKVKSKIVQEKQKYVEEAVLEGKEEGIEIKNVEGKGRGIFAIQPFQKGDFVCEYHGEHIDYDTAKKREKRYSEDENIGCYMYYFSFKNKKYCVDATQESGRLGRLLNHSVNGNCTTKLIPIKDKPYLILVAAKDIQPGSELLYDYGERSKDVIASHPWLQA